MVASLPICLTALLAAVPCAWAVPSARVRGLVVRQNIMDEQPAFPHDPNTAPSCRWWWDNDGSIACKDMPAEWGITIENFLAWNPSITADCGNYITGRSYCVEADPPTTGPPSSTTSAPATTTTPPGNGVATPTPRQAMVGNCNKFYFVKKNEQCGAIASANGISAAQFIQWNPDVGSDCTGMWAEVYVCVGVIGQTTTPPSPTTPGNGVATPTPHQAMVGNCNKFYFVKKGDQCGTISSNNGISTAQFVQWNPDVGSDCLGMWAEVYVCIGVIGQTPSTTARPTTTTPGNGIVTPTPTQATLVNNCNKFYFVKKGESCDVVASKNGISAAQVVSWNPSVGSDCKGLWAEAYACVGIIGQTPPKPTTTTGNGIATPTPTQARLVANCNKFYFVKKGDSCWSIANGNRITQQQFINWNYLDSECKGLWAEAYSCIGVRT